MVRTNRNVGFGIIEILVAAAIISTAIFSLFNVFVLANRLSGEAGNKIRANFLAEEGLEVLRYLRDDSWSRNLAGLTAGTSYYISFNSGTSQWSIGTTNPGVIDSIYTRVITLENVSRDSSDNIVSSGGTNDPNTKKFNASMTWSERGAIQTLLLSTYLADSHSN
jgi:Tfp pilus assembly protein PilV